MLPTACNKGKELAVPDDVDTLIDDELSSGCDGPRRRPDPEAEPGPRDVVLILLYLFF